MDLFKSLPLKKQVYMNRLFRNCTEEVKYYMSVIDVEARKYLFMEGKDRLMVHLVRKYEQKIPAPEILVLNQTRARISEEVGISIKTLDRNIRKLEEMNLLKLNKGKIVITKAQYLQMKQDIDFYVNG